MFENIPTHLAVDDITSLTATASNLASSFATAIDLSGAGASVAFTLDDSTDVGQLKVIYAKTEPASTYSANIEVTNWGYSSTAGTEIVLDSQGEAVICFWDGSKWYPISVFGATVQ